MLRRWASNTFVETPADHADPGSSRYVVLPIAYEGTACYGKGARLGPDAIIEASTQIEDFDEGLHDVYWRDGIYTDSHVMEEASPEPEAVYDAAFATAQRWVSAGKTIIGLGGEHSITPPLVAAARQRHMDLTVLHFDAHADLRDAYHGSKLNHACVMRRLAEMGVPFVSVGIRSVSRPEYDWARAHGVTWIGPEEVADQPRQTLNRVLSLLGPRVYVTFDIDALDPSVAPGTGTPEPGGLTYRQACAVLAEVLSRRELVGADVVEVAPVPGSHVTEVTAARLVAKMIGYDTARRHRK